MSMGTGAELGRKGKYTLAQALNRVYIVKSKGATENKKGIGVIHVPSILVGKRVRVVVEVDDKETS